MSKSVILAGSLAVSALALAAPLAGAQEKPADTLVGAISASKPILDLRLRYEGVEQDGVPNDADALTWRLRAGFETGSWNRTSLLVDFDLVEDVVDDFNSTTNGNGAYPVIPDPTTAELNRLQLTTTLVPKTKVTIGRQRIIMDDARFVGNVGWRQNEQTFDAVRATNTALGKAIVDVAYVTRTHRIFGEESAQGRFTGDTYLVNVSNPTPIGKMTGFAYLVDIDEGGGVNSSQTYGLRLTGDQEFSEGSLKYAASIARQGDYGSSDLNYDADFYSASLDYSHGAIGVGAGFESLGGDVQRGFQTPLATLHAFQGWTDKFLTTPNAGVEDLYASASFTAGDVGLFKGVKLSAVYHDFNAEMGSADYGSEIGAQATASIEKLKFGLKFAQYDADTFATDTTKFWLWVEYGF